MTPRKADLRVAHQAGCANKQKTSLESLSGCTCKPRSYVDQDGKQQTGRAKFYVSWRDHTGATKKSERTLDRKLAEKMLRAQQVEIDKGNIGYHEVKQATFRQWADEYEQILSGTVKGATQRAYIQTLDIGREAFGHINVRAIGYRDLDRFVAAIAGRTDAIKAKHLGQLGTCLSKAIPYGYLDANANPVPAYKKDQRLKVPKGTPPFTDPEVEALLAAMAVEETVYTAVVRAAILTGCRIGELVALTWSCVRTDDKRLEVWHTYDQVDGIVDPKDGESRIVYLTAEAVDFFNDWREWERPTTDDALVFPAPRAKHHLNADYMRKVVSAAMETASLPKLDERTRRPRKPLHSLRATYTRQQLEKGKNPQWVQANLGHSGLELTIGVYGSWTEAAMLAEAKR